MAAAAKATTVAAQKKEAAAMAVAALEVKIQSPVPFDHTYETYAWLTK